MKEIDVFPAVIGHTGVKERIYSIINSENIPHAFLFSGKEGIGKFNLALEIVKYLTKKRLSEPEYALEQIKNLREPYITYVFPLPRGKNETAGDNPYAAFDEKMMDEIRWQLEKKIENPYYEINIPSAQNIKISSVRAIKKSLSVNKNDVPVSAIIIDKAELMSVEAQNSLLKSLEEPPAGVMFFLLTKDESLLLPTIKSRCWTVNFSNLTKNDIAEILGKYFELDKETISKIAPFANGSVKEAAKFFDEEKIALLDLVIDFLRYGIVGKFNTALKILNEALELTENDLQLVINLISLWLEDALINKTDATSEYSFEDYKDTFVKFNRAFPEAEIVQVINALQQLVIAHNQNVSLKIILLNIIFLISSLGNRQI